ncbi:MAG TPA: integrase arm-type DNA-binding domain-containing protein [Gemmataceae bacterium]|jgi:integrase|nr:integrase arm-type DNA-binding domain-containing protein [Gemmataceae bacterium]
MPLTDARIRNAKPRAKKYKVFDGDGLYLEVWPTGAKYWRMKYYVAKKEKVLALGVYPHISLADARERRVEARKLLAAGRDPSEEKKETKRQAAFKAANTFEAVAKEWLEKRAHEWSPRHVRTRFAALESYVFPSLGPRPIGEITAPQVLAMLRPIEAKGILHTAQRMMQLTGQVFMYAIATGRAERNPVPDLRGALKTPIRENHSYLKESELPEYLKKLEAYDGDLLTKQALRLLLLTFVRTTELRAAEWTEIDWDKAEWRIPKERMKMKEPHIVPLSTQAIAVLKELQKLSSHRRFLFPNGHNPSTFMSENTMLYALYRMGYHSRATGHGFRSTASTILNEHGFHADVIERQLAHGERNKVRAAYNHAQYLPERREMMQWWANQLDALAAKK